MQTIVLDFDGVLNTYSGWDGDNLYEPRSGSRQFLAELSKKYNVVITSMRPVNKITDWLVEYELIDYISKITNVKQRAVAYVDDRGLQFNGDYQEILDKLDNFKAHWEE